MPLARDILIDILRDEGVTHIFGNPGSTEMPLMDALVDAPDLTYVLGLQEATAVGMADGWALASGKVGFVNLHAMGGLGNAMGVLVASKASETPLVVTAGQQDTRHLMTEPWLSGDLVALAAPVDQMGARGPARRGRRARRCAAPSPSPARRPAARCSCRCRWTCSTRRSTAPTPPASRRRRGSARRRTPRALAERLAGLDPDKGRRAARRRSAGRREPRPRRLRRERAAFRCWGAQITSRAAFPSDASLLGGRDEAGFRLDARALPRRRRRSCWSAGAPSSPIPIARSGRCPRASRSCMSPTIRKPSAANTPPTWRCSATSARRWPTPRRASARARRRAAVAAAARRARRAPQARRSDALRAEILAEPGGAAQRRRRRARRARRHAGKRADRQRFRRDLRPACRIS